MKTKPAPQLKQFASFWTLTGQPPDGPEWSVEEKVRRARQAGFDAVSGRARLDIAAAAHAAGMEFVCYLDANDRTWRERLESAAATRPARVNVQLWDHDTPPKVAVNTWIRMQPVAEKLGLEIDLEVHRDTCTETPEKTREIAERYQAATGRICRFCFDHSHPAVVKHLVPPYADRLLGDRRLVQSARQIHLRPFNGHHCQVPFTDGRGRISAEGRQYLDFVEALFALWLKGARGGETLYVCPELGPRASGYALTTFPDVWSDAVRLRSETESLWKKQIARRLCPGRAAKAH